MKTYPNSPYYDDFNEEKGFHRILFKPGRAVQARELTQLQTTLQNQIARFGQNIFKEGSIVIPGQQLFDLHYHYVKLTPSYNGVASNDILADIVGGTVTGQTTGVIVQIVNYAESTDGDPPTIYVKYTSSGSDKTTNRFDESELLTISYGTNTATLQVAAASATGKGVAFSVASGVIFVKDNFVYFGDETIIVSKYSDVPSKSVGFLITESVITSDDDASILDPATGSYNYFAPGADRYSISLSLQARTLPEADGVDNNYVELSRIQEGVTIYQKVASSYNVLGDILARRTYDESGNYTVRPYGIENIEHLRTSVAGIRDGLYSAAAGGNADLIASVISPGKAYVLGYEIELLKNKYVVSPKARDSATVNNSTISSLIGNYLTVSGLYSVPDLATLSTVDLYNYYTSSSGSASGTRVGTARIRSIEYVSGSGTSAIYNVYLFDIQMLAGYAFEKDVKQIYYNNAGFVDFTANISPTLATISGTVTTTDNNNTIVGVGTKFNTELRAGDYVTINGNVSLISSVVSDTAVYASASLVGNVSGVSASVHTAVITNVPSQNDATYLFEFPYSTIKDVDPTNTETSYYTKRAYDRTLSTGNVAITAGTDEVFAPFSTTNYIVVDKSDGSYVPLSSTNVTRSGVPTGKTVTFTLGAGYGSHDVRIIATVAKSNSAADKKTKTLVSGSTVDFTSNTTATATVLSLGQADIYAVSNIRMSANAFGTAYMESNSVDITSRYTIDNGQRSSHYDIGSVKLIPGQPIPTGPVRINFDYFTHSSGDYFSVNSYGDIDYKDIPSFTKGAKTYQLRDCLDFRPRIDTNGTTFTNPSEFLDQDVDILTDYSYYLPRTDKIVLDSSGEMRLVMGVSSLTPQEPATPKNSMALFVLAHQPYVFDVKKDIDVTVIDNRRFTMRDIGKLENRIKTLEYYTTLSLLENDTSLFQIKDSFGFDRFKNGFVVDNFTGHRVGNPLDSDYKISMDFQKGIMRPTFTQTNYRLKEIAVNDTQRTSNNYVLTGNIASLAYTSNVFVESNAASRVENINPFSVISHIGTVVLDPPSDIWFDTERLPEVHIDKEGNYSTLLASAQSSGLYGTIWGSWQTNYYGGAYIDVRQGTNYDVKESIDTVTNNDVAVSQTVIPKMRNVVINFTGAGLKPNTKLQVYFDNYKVTDFSTASVNIDPAADANIVPDYFYNKGNVFTDANGTVSGSFFYDASHFNFSTGEKTFRLTDSPTNGNDSETAAEAKFNTSGQLTVLQNQIISTRNGYATSEAVYDQRASSYVSPPSDGGGGGGGGGDGGGSRPANTYIDAVYGIAFGRLADQDGANYWVERGNMSTIARAADTISDAGKQFLASYVVSSNNIDAKGLYSNWETASASLSDSDRAAISSTFESISQITQAGAANNEQGRLGSGTTAIWIASGEDQYAAAQYSAAQLTIQLLSDNYGGNPVIQAINDNPDRASSELAAVSPPGESVPRSCWGEDPLAQTFIISSNPVVLSGVDVFFYSKDSTMPMYVEIRTVVNGFPSQTVVPFSRRIVTPNQISLSDDGSVATHINFDGLVYLEPGEYALVLLTTSLNYRVWISQIGETDVATGRVISEQPFIGVLFKSQNASTWEANQNQDLKFRIYSATFTSNTPATLDFEVDPADYRTVKLGFDPLQFYPNSSVLKVYHPNNGFVNGSTVKLFGVPGDNSSNAYIGAGNICGVNVSTINNVEFAVSNVRPDSYTIILPASSNTTSIVRAGGNGIVAERDVLWDAIYPAISALEFAGTTADYSVKVVDKGYSPHSTFDIIKGTEATELDTTAVLPSDTNITNNLSGARPFTLRITLNNTNSLLSPLIDMEQLSAVFIKNIVNNPSYSSENLAEDVVTVANSSSIFFTKKSANTGYISIVSNSDKANVSGIVKGTTITTANSAVNSGSFRVLDVIDSGANILVAGNITTAAAGNVITITNGRSFIAEEAATGGSALAKYITRQVDFVNPSTSINLRMDVAKPINSYVKVYYKTKLVGESTDLSTKEYVELPGITIPDSLGGEFFEITRQVDDLAQFTSIVFKIVLLSDDSADVPKCKNLRIIALQ